ncbi:Outer membrane receptor proteins, mostly Fe transport [Sphingopyxis sp. YR583]|jgi:iron complex outermembrane receptor protein|uniref:TonB-dependent receptor n=1 Tax=Sphingopyxis sp. YR583 TaxID=1881047 RepID=UPI0008A7FA1D|nr:TonB-dependent receptor [Sphingopyxis sp. YR583]SEH11189.1 Outer membrane receptor proteins, mostly Fe transport [Sphingopyxis sp. YR583]
MKKHLVALLAASALASPGIAFAQDTAPAEDQGGLEEIIVTAQKRAEGLSDVPISISAVSGKQVESYGQTNLEQISSSVPNLKITQTAIANRIAIRGIASGDNKGFEQSVAMFVDGVYYGRDQLSRLPLVDMERVEVLRGPQPTLFGKNAIAGAVNITTRSPTDEFEGSVSGLYEFNHKEFQLTGVLSGPLSEGIEARVVGYHRSMDGYFYNQKLDRDEPNVDEYYFRGKLELDKGGPFAAELKLEYADFEMKGQPRDVFGAVGNYNTVFQGPFFVSTTPDYVREDNGYESKNKVFGATLNADLEVGEHTLTSVSSLLDYKTREIVDVDFSGISFLDGTNLREDYRQFSQELRLTSPGGEAFNYIAGVYYQHAKLDVQDFTRFNSTFLALGAPFNALGDTRNDRDYAQKSDLISAFAQGELSVTDQLRITAGARFNHEKKSGSRSLAIVQGPLNTFNPLIVAATFRALNIEAHSVSGKLSEDSFNPMVNVQYDATDDLMLYASYAKGTKAGGFDIRSNSLPGSTTVAKPGAFMFEDESADNFEAGLKYKGRNVAFNLSLYRTDYKDLQVNIFDGTLNFNVRNAAEARTQGVEADFRAALAQGLTISGAVAYLDFKFSNFTDGQCYYLQTPGANGFCDYSGKRNALSPKWSGNLNLDYTTPVTTNMKVAFNVNADFSSSYIASANLDPRTHQDGYVKLGARLALAQVDDRWEVALIGRNLTNQRILQTASSMPLATTITRNAGNAYNGIVDRPRTIAVQLTGRF